MRGGDSRGGYLQRNAGFRDGADGGTGEYQQSAGQRPFSSHQSGQSTRPITNTLSYLLAGQTGAKFDDFDEFGDATTTATMWSTIWRWSASPRTRRVQERSGRGPFS